MTRAKTAHQADELDAVRHSLAHLLAAAVLDLYPGTKNTIGPAIEHGFYYDFEFPSPISETDLPAIEAKMRGILPSWKSFERQGVTPAEAQKRFAGNPYKLELINEFSGEGKTLSLYTSGPPAGGFTDLCRGGHVDDIQTIDTNGFKLDRIAGAYWRGKETNTMLTRIYGLAFASKADLDTYLALREEAKKRDHREIGKRQKLFTFNELVGSGLPLWLPNGTIIKDEIERFAKETEVKAGYLRVSTPHIAKAELFKKSGHLPHYADLMFPPMKLDDGSYYLKAMNCPIHHLIYQSEPRSYRDLPLRLAEYGTVYRNELSGTLAGLLRVRMLSMNDAHIYCRADQIAEEFRAVLSMTLDYFTRFGLTDYSFRLSLWDPKNKEKYIDEPENWGLAEQVLRGVLTKLNVDFVEAENEAAFYGPKVDIQYRSIGGREETMSTIQLDFAAKGRFGLVYHDASGRENSEVFVIHRAPLSTHERFIAYLIEHYAGAFPAWLSPVQARILAVGEKYAAYATEVGRKLREAGVRIEVDDSNETLGKRIRASELAKIPYTLVVGEKETAAGTVNVRTRGKKETATVPLMKFVADITAEIRERRGA